nr:mediator of rna polymerase ii transcription subunit 32 [Quercus suber]
MHVTLKPIGKSSKQMIQEVSVELELSLPSFKVATVDGAVGEQLRLERGGEQRISERRRAETREKGRPKMDNIVESLNNAYQDFVAAAANVLEAKEIAGAQKTTATDAALENFKQKWELFRVACDQAEEFVESVKQRIGSECLVDEATGSPAGKSGQSTGLPPISAVRLEQMSSLKMQLNSAGDH